MVEHFFIFDGNLFRDQPLNFLRIQYTYVLDILGVLTISTSKNSHQSTEYVDAIRFHSAGKTQHVENGTSATSDLQPLQAVLVLGLLNTLRFPMNILAAPWHWSVRSTWKDDLMAEPMKKHDPHCQVCEFQSLIMYDKMFYSRNSHMFTCFFTTRSI